MNPKTCFFIGNRHTPYNIKENLTNVVEQHIVKYGVTTFIVGHYGSFDSLVTEVLLKAKKQYTYIELYLLVPYPFDKRIEIPRGFNGTYYPEGMEKVPKSLAIVQANRKMVGQSNYLITYCHNIGNTRNIVEYAQKREKKGLIKITLL